MLWSKFIKLKPFEVTYMVRPMIASERESRHTCTVLIQYIQKVFRHLHFFHILQPYAVFPPNLSTLSHEKMEAFPVITTF